MNLKQFRDQFPNFCPNALCEHQDGRQLEVISWPYYEDEEEVGPVFIKARSPLDPTTIATYRISGEQPDLLPLMGWCEYASSAASPFPARLNEMGQIRCELCQEQVRLLVTSRDTFVKVNPIPTPRVSL